MPQTRPLSRLKTLIARNMHRAMQETAHATLHTECDVTALVDMLRDGDAGVKVGTARVSTYVLYALAQALQEHPEMNAHLGPDELCLYEQIKLGLMVDTGQGVMMACISNAGDKTLDEIEEAVRDLNRRAGDRQLAVTETRGATFLVADLSAYPVDTFTPILLPSAIAILGIGRVRPACRPTADGCRPVQLLSLSLTFDHRGTDGLAAGRLLASLIRLLEQPVPGV